MVDSHVPVMIGVGQITEKDPDRASSPLALMEQATWSAFDDAGLSRRNAAAIDALVVVKSFREPMRNSPEALANKLGAQGARQWLTPDGGYGPQYLVNRFSEAIARGEHEFVLLSGAEAMATGRKIIKSGQKIPWDVPSENDPEYLYADRDMWNSHERLHGVWQASAVYPLFENAIRAHLGRGLAEHQQALGELFAPFTEIAEQSPHAWFPIRRSAEEIATATPDNRYVGWPYTKYMNAMNQINQSASLLLTSEDRARQLGVDESRWVYLHGCADVTELWDISSRVNYYSSPAINLLGRQAFAMAGIGIDDIDFLDLYSCFPSAVQIACNELGIHAADGRSLTVTGGLPFHGGAGNNYVMNSIATMADKLRQAPGKYGLITANGGYLSRHSAGIYSTTRVSEPWHRPDPETYQQEIDALAHPPFIEDPDGDATIETYSVVYGRGNEPEFGIVMGRLGNIIDPAAPRFIASTPRDAALLKAMTESEFVGRRGRVSKEGEINIFTPAI